jgi:general stress protein YciG
MPSRKSDEPPISVADAGRRGGRATAAKHGTAHFKKIGSLGGSKARILVQQGRAQEQADEEIVAAVNPKDDDA